MPSNSSFKRDLKQFRKAPRCFSQRLPEAFGISESIPLPVSSLLNTLGRDPFRNTVQPSADTMPRLWTKDASKITACGMSPISVPKHCIRQRLKEQKKRTAVMKQTKSCADCHQQLESSSGSPGAFNACCHKRRRKIKIEHRLKSGTWLHSYQEIVLGGCLCRPSLSSYS